MPLLLDVGMATKVWASWSYAVHRFETLPLCNHSSFYKPCLCQSEIFLNLWASSKQSAFKWVTPKGTDCLLHIQSIPWVTLFNRDAFFSCSCAGAPGLSRFLLNSESVNFVTQSFKMISRGSKIAAYIFCECHRKFYRVLCKSPKKELRLSLQGDTRSREGWGAHHLTADACIDIMGTQSAYSLVDAVTWD